MKIFFHSSKMIIGSTKEKKKKDEINE